MATEGKRVSKAVVYKRVNFLDKQRGVDLKTMLDAALKKRVTVGDRRRNIGADEVPSWQLIGASTSEKDGLLFGALMTYSPGIDPLFLVDDESAESITLEKLKAPKTKDGKRRELLESVLFFAAIRNHMVLMQSQGLKSPQFEQYLTWFLRDAKVLSATNTMTLVDTPTQAIKDRVEAGNGVREIRIGGEVLPRSFASGSKSEQSKSLTVSTDSSQSGTLEAVKALMRPSDIAKIDFDKLAGSNIEMTLTLRYKSKTSVDGHKLMDSLGAVFRNTDDVDTEVDLTDGSTIKGSELKVHGHVRVTSYDGQLSTSEVNEALRQWLLNKIKDQEN